MEKGAESNNMTKEEKKKKMFKCKWPGCDADPFERAIDLARHVRLEHRGKGKVPEKVAKTAEEEARGEGKIEEEKKGALELEAGAAKLKEEGDIVISTPPPKNVDMTGMGILVGAKPLAREPQPPAEEVNNIYRALKETGNKYEALLLSYPEVTGVGIGRTADGRPAIEILVCKRCAEHEDIPKSLDGVPVVIHEVGGGKAVESPAGEAGPGSETERKETLIDKLAHAKKLGVFFEGPIRKSLRKWLMRRREGKTGGEKKGER